MNPFEDDSQDFLVLTNRVAQRSLWPAFAAVPDGWVAEFGPASREECTDHINAAWTDLRPQTISD